MFFSRRRRWLGPRAEAECLLLDPGAVTSELKFSNGDVESAAGIQVFYDIVEISADSIARAVACAIEQPENVAVNEITIRPTKQEF